MSSIGSSNGGSSQYFQPTQSQYHEEPAYTTYALFDQRTFDTNAENSDMVEEMPLDETSLAELSIQNGLQVTNNSQTSIFAQPILRIDIDELKQNPKHYILKLGEHLSNKSELPHIIYIQNNEICEGLDTGGLGRDLFSLLFKDGFQIQEDCSGAINTKSYLVLDMDRNPKSVGEKNEEDHYRAIGRLLKLCLLDEATFKTGPLFSETVYTCIQKAFSNDMGEIDTENNNWFLYSSLKFKNFSDDLIYKLQGNSTNFDEKEYGFIMGLIYDFIDENVDNLEKSKDFMSLKPNRDRLRHAIQNRGKRDPNLRLIFAMTSEIKKSLNQRMKDSLSNLKPIQFIEKIEGHISKQSVKENLLWNTLDTDKKIQTRNFLENWVDAADKESLRKFVYSISSLNTLAGKKFTIHIGDVQFRFPEVNTCDCKFFLSSCYKNQEEFNEHMAVYFENALVGTGFQKR